MKPLDELIDKNESGWLLVNEWIYSAKNKIVILPVDTNRAKESLYKTQVTTRSPMGAIIYNTGGLLIDDGWIRILGSGSDKLKRTLPEWNEGKCFKKFGERPSFLLIADDVIGGYYMLNGGGLGKDVGKVYYFSPDNLKYEALDITYSEFLHFCFNGNIDEFYKSSRWKNWRKDVSKLDGNQVFNFTPFLWSKEGKNINKNERNIVSVESQYHFNLNMRKQLGLD